MKKEGPEGGKEGMLASMLVICGQDCINTVLSDLSPSQARKSTWLVLSEETRQRETMQGTETMGCPFLLARHPWHGPHVYCSTALVSGRAWGTAVVLGTRPQEAAYEV